MNQTEWYCDDCEVGHFGNCPRMTVTTTSTHITEEETHPPINSRKEKI